MAGLQLDTALSEEVVCAICLCRLDNPRILSCLHSFCEKCLLKCKINDIYYLTCSVCRERTELPRGGVKGLRLDFRAARLVDLLTEDENRKLKMTCPTHKCETCGCEESLGENSPFQFCLECGQVLCSRCSLVHSGLRSSRDHTVASLSDVLSGKVSTKPKQKVVFCPKHCDEKLKLFCETCSELICHDCTLFDHARESGHEFHFLSDFTGRMRQELTSRLSKVNSQIEKFSHFITSLGEVDEVIRRHDERTKQEIEAAIEKHIGHIQSHGEAEVANHHQAIKGKSTKIQQLRQLAQRMKERGLKSLQMTESVLGNPEDLIGMASMYKSLREAMDKTIANNPDEWQLNSIKQSVGGMHFHSIGSEAKIGRVFQYCACNKERSEIDVVCANGPKDVEFTHSGRITVLVDESSIPTDKVLFYTSGTEELYSRQKKWETRNKYTAYPHDTSPVFRQTNTPYPFSKTFAWSRPIPDLKYDNIKSFSTLSANRFAIVSIDSKVSVLTDTLHTIIHPSFSKYFWNTVTTPVTGIASDNKECIYLSDSRKVAIDIIRDDGSLIKKIPIGQISPTGITVSHLHPDHIVVTHDPATVCILDREGKVKASIHKDTWMKVKVACSTHNLYVLWSNREGKVTLQRYTMEGTLVDTLIDKETHPCKDLIMAVSSDGTVAIVKATGKVGKILVLHPRK